MSNHQDLSGNDLKYVSYSILFTKRDYEAVLEQQVDDLVNYSTNGASYGALKVSDFFGRLHKGEIKRPPLWRELNYPPGEKKDDPILRYIPEEDKKYVTFVYQVDDRLPKSDREYEKEQTRALEDIARKV